MSAGQSASTQDGSSFSETEVDEGFVRISKLAVGSLLLALFSSIAVISPSMLAASMVAVVLGTVALWRIRRDHTLGGATFACWAIGLGLIFGSWSFTSARLHTRHLYESAGNFSRIYLQYLSAGDTFKAMELRKSEPDRQIAGTQLELVYAGDETEASVEMRDFLDRPATKSVLECGREADWRYVRGVSIIPHQDAQFVTVEMENVANDRSFPIFVTLRRATGLISDEEAGPAALWNVVREFLPGD